jgi:uroporphyrinogen decarboxylase
MESKKELVFKALKNIPTSRVPVGFWHHYLPDEHVNAVEHPEYYDQNVTGARAFHDAWDPDFVKVMTDGYFDLPIVLDLSSAETLKQFKPVPFTDPWFQGQLKLLKENRDIYGEDIAMFYNIFSPLWHLEAAVRRAAKVTEPESHDIVLEFIRSDPEAVAETLDHIADNLRPLIYAVLAPGGADGIYFSAQDMHRYIPDVLYRLYVTPSDKKILEIANTLSEYNIIHICGWRGNTNYLTVYQDYPATAFNWACNTEDLSLKEGKKFFGGKCVIGGFLNTEESILFTGNKAEIQNFTEKLLNEVGRVGVIVGADCTLPRSVDYEKLKWVREICDRPSKKVVI